MWSPKIPPDEAVIRGMALNAMPHLLDGFFLQQEQKLTTRSCLRVAASAAGNAKSVTATSFLTSAVLATLFGGALLAGPAGAQSFNLSGWDRVWTDQFNGSSVNTGRWEVADREFSPNNELQYYHPDQVSVGGGQLTITASDQPLGAGGDIRDERRVAVSDMWTIVHIVNRRGDVVRRLIGVV